MLYVEPVKVKCPECGEQIAEYRGPTGMKVPIRSRYYVRNDGSSPEHESSATGTCPHCKQSINELEATLIAVSLHLNPSIPTIQREPFPNEPAPDSD